MAALPEGFLIRVARPDDVEAVAALEAEVFPDPWPYHLYLQEVRQPLRFQRIVSNSGGYLVAYLFACWQADELHVLKVATHPLYQGRGLGTALLQEARGEAERGQGRGVILEVRPSNRVAFHLYRNLGYHVLGRRPRYYGDGEDALVMFLSLPAPQASFPPFAPR
jgi:[ribosomal protein S18]-alanine N-acetyltransferase